MFCDNKTFNYKRYRLSRFWLPKVSAESVCNVLKYTLPLQVERLPIMKKVYYLSSCDTCKRILEEIEIPQSFILQDIKTEGLTDDEVEELFNLSGSYEALFSKRAQLYKQRNLKEEILLEEDYKNLLLEHYTFLKRPVIINNDEIFIGNSKKTVAAAKKSIHD